MTNRPKPRNYQFLDKFTYYLPGVGGMFVLLGLLLAGSLVGNILSIPFIAMFGFEKGLLYAQFIGYPIMFVAPMIYASVQSRNNSFTRPGLSLDNNHFSPLGGALCAILVILATLAASFCSDSIQLLLPEMPERLQSTMKILLKGDNIVINFLMVSVFAPFFEEWLCRGMVLRGLLANKIKPVWAIVISAVFFGVIHLNPWQAVPAILLGLLFGYVYYKTGSLKLTMLMHFANNTCALVLSNLTGLENAEGWQDVLPGLRYWLVFGACILVLVLIIPAFARIPVERTEGNMDPVKPLFEE